MRKPRLQPSLASLTEAEREQLADWLRREHYDVVLDRVNKPRPEGFALDISDKPLRIFYGKVALLDLINARLPKDKQISLAHFESLARRDIHFLLSADDKTFAQAHQSILNAAVDLTSSGDNTPAQLATLQRLVDFPARAEIRANKEERDQAKEERAAAKAILQQQMHTHKIKMDELRLQLAERNTQVREQTLALRRDEISRRATHAKAKTDDSKLSPPNDELGPLARNWEDVRERARKHFGITPEESARRAELRKTWRPSYIYPDPEETPDTLPDGTDVPAFLPSPAGTSDNNLPGSLSSPEGTPDNSPALSVPGNSFPSIPVPQRRLNTTASERASIAINQSTLPNGANAPGSLSSPEGTPGNSPALSVPGNSFTSIPVPQGRLNTTASEQASIPINQSTWPNGANVPESLSSPEGTPDNSPAPLVPGTPIHIRSSPGGTAEHHNTESIITTFNT